MSNTESEQSMTDTAVRTDGGTETKQSLRQRVLSNPEPAAIWLAGLALLVAVELGRFVDWALTIGGGIKFILDGIVATPTWVGSNFEGTLGFVAGAVASDITSLLLLFIVAVFLRAYLPFHPDEKLGLDLSRSRHLWFERGFVTAVLAAVVSVLVFTPIGAALKNEVGFYVGILDSLADTQTLLSRETIPNHGYQTASGSWEGTFLGLSARSAWLVRFTMVWVYAAVVMSWLWRGYNVYREHYRRMDWTPRDDVIDRLRSHNWGRFGLVVVIGFIVLALFAPVIATYPIQENVYEPYSQDSEFKYFNEEAGEVQTALHGDANINSRSQGAGSQNVGINQYDDYGRYAPLGTTTSGEDLMTHIAYGAQTSLSIGLIALFLALGIAMLLSLASAYYGGIIDLMAIIGTDTIISIPIFVLVLMMSVVFQQGDVWIAEPMDGGLLLALIFAFAYMPGMWRSIRGPSLQVAEEEWVDAAKSYGQTPLAIMRKHMAPYVMSYLIIYGSLLVGGMIIVTSALSFLGYGVSEPTPEWGRLIASGRNAVSTQSWHVSTVSGAMIAIVVTGFNALGDGIRDAIDPQAEANAGGSGGGA
ncbi:ABC transporter permease [Halovenus rubra]|uniref:ABC transporter permease n=2 Tax=Halovenus rubra TaxID=869890 RepID=A0ABD5X5E1_9EURY|nr:ABC transporter permease [Halovenus rubra]